MFDTLAYVKQDMAYQHKLEKLFSDQLQYLPNGRLTRTKKNGESYYYKVLNGKRTYLGKGNSEEVLDLQEKRFLEESLKRIRKNLAAGNAFLKKYQNIDEGSILKETPQAYQPIVGAAFFAGGKKNLDRWEKEPYQRSTAYPERLIHRTMRGDLVRSKSEVIIANTLFSKGIPYRYEELIQVGDYTVAADFHVAVKSRSRKRLWEHFGMIGDADYLEKCMLKIQTYIENGFLPWEDVIFTFDTKRGSIDAQTIERIAELFCR